MRKLTSALLLSTATACGAPQIVLSDSNSPVEVSPEVSQTDDVEKNVLSEPSTETVQKETKSELECFVAMLDCVGYGKCEVFTGEECDKARE